MDRNTYYRIYKDGERTPIVCYDKEQAIKTVEALNEKTDGKPYAYHLTINLNAPKNSLY